MSINLIIEQCKGLAQSVGQYCMRCPEKSEEIVRQGNEIAGIYDKHIITFIAAKDNMVGWDLSKVKDFIKVAEDLEERFNKLHKFAYSKS
jgi:hypothetical protein